MQKDLEKFQKENPEFVSEVSGLSKDQLDARLAQLAKDGASVDQAKEEDEELKRMREEVSMHSAPYRDSKKAIRLKTKFIIALLEGDV